MKVAVQLFVGQKWRMIWEILETCSESTRSTCVSARPSAGLTVPDAERYSRNEYLLACCMGGNARFADMFIIAMFICPTQT